MRLILPLADPWKLQEVSDGVVGVREEPRCVALLAPLESVPVEPKQWRNKVSKRSLPPNTRFEDIKGSVLDGTPWSAGVMEARVVDDNGVHVEDQLQVFYQVLWFAAHVAFRFPPSSPTTLRDELLAIARKADLDWKTEEVTCLADVWAP